MVPSDGEIRVAQAQLVGWLRGAVPRDPGDAVRPAAGGPPAARADAPAYRERRRRPAAPPGPGARRRRTAPARTFSESGCTWYGVVGVHPRHRQCNHTDVHSSTSDSGHVRGGFVHTPPRPHRVLDARRRGPARRAGGQGGRRRAAGARHHRPRQHVRRRSSSTRSAGRRAIKPIIGTEAYMAHDRRSERPPGGAASTTPAATPRVARSSTTTSPCWPRTTTGYRNLIQLASLAFLEGYYYKPRMDWELPRELPRGSDRHHRLPRRSRACSRCCTATTRRRSEKAGRLQDIFGADNLFVELQDHGLAAQRETNPQLLEIARKHRAPAAGHQRLPLHPPRRPRGPRRPAVRADRRDALSDPKRFKFEGHEHYLKTADEMRYLFRDVPEACDNTLWIAERADVDIEFGKPAAARLPAARGLRRRPRRTSTTSRGPVPGERWGDDLPPAVVERLAYELQVINDMGFASYFLIVWDLIKHARDVGIRVGPGRGSAAGCAVAYCLRITDLDPIQLRPAVRALPQPEPHLDARHRHGLRLPLPRTR